jgi:hypothetical protein
VNVNPKVEILIVLDSLCIDCHRINMSCYLFAQNYLLNSKVTHIVQVAICVCIYSEIDNVRATMQHIMLIKLIHKYRSSMHGKCTV